jgi:Pyruvate/2-oxoacid:ferredoxin oxidoreductase gamma subunit
MNKRIVNSMILGAAAALLGASSLMANDDGDRDHGRDRDGKFVVRADLIGFQEVPAVSTGAHGRFRAVVDTVANTITFRLTYDGIETAVQQAHVHFGQKSVNGGVSFFLCSNLANPPAGTQACPVPPAEVTGVITPDQVIGPAGQGIEAASFAEIAAAMDDGTAYANVHSARWPGGEIRGQLH